MTESRPLRIGIVAGEPSGDNLGAGLIREFRKQYPTATFVGIGGPAMGKQGCERLYDMTRIEAMGLDEIAGKFLDILKIRRALVREFSDHPPDLFIGIDVPDFNLTLEEKLRSRGITTVHYVSPTVWAWRGYRIHKIRRAVSHMLTLFPFEARYYEEQQIPVSCVGHPIADQIDKPDRDRARQELADQVTVHGTVVALLPGSRRAEVKQLGAVMVDAARQLHRENPSLQFLVPAANDRTREIFLEVAGAIDDLPITILDGQSRLALEASDMAILASGTAALEAALLERPHVVVYRVSALTWWLFKRLRHVQYYSMTNHLLTTPDVPELIQDDVTAENVAMAARRYLGNAENIRDLVARFREIRAQLRLNADVQAAAVVSGILSAQPTGGHP